MTRQRAIINFLNELSSVNLHGFLISLDGQNIAEGYWAPFHAEEPHRLYSVSKSVVSLAIGILAGEGKLTLEDHIVDYFPEWVNENTHPMLREVTIRNMLMMSTCYDRAQYTCLVDADWTKPFFYGRPTHPAGTLFHYDTSASQVLCALVEKITGREILTFMEQHLFAPLGMNGPKKWLKDRAGTSQGGTGLLMTLRDFSKLADFCMSDGRDLVPADYLRGATACQITTRERSNPEERHGYGYQFWQMRKGFSMYGLGGQMGICLPEQQLSLCTIGNTMLSGAGVQPIYDVFFRHLDGIAALPSGEDDQRELEQRLQQLILPTVDTISISKTMHIDLQSSSLAFTALTIAPDYLAFRLSEGDVVLPYAVNGWADGIFPSTTERCITSGGWEGEGRFRAICEVKDDFICNMELVVSIKGDRASLCLNGRLWELVNGWNGLAWGCCTAQ